MIFCSKNEKGELAADLVMQGRKTVTRRLKPIEVGKIRAVQPNRCKKGIGYIRVLSCMKHENWLIDEVSKNKYYLTELCEEARREGFTSWYSIIQWFGAHKINIDDTYRIEFEVVKW